MCVDISVKNLSRRYSRGPEEIIALQGTDLEFSANTLNVFVGPSGSGKSTLLALLGLLDTSDEKSSLTIGDSVIDCRTPAHLARARARHVGFLFQDAGLIDRMSILDNAALPLAYRGISSRERRDIAMGCLKEVGLETRAGHLPGQLSGGERQRAGLARAMASQPDILICDEPTAALDEERGAQMAKLIKAASQKAVVIVATHDPCLIAEADHVYVLDRGAVRKATCSHDFLNVGLAKMASAFTPQASAAG
jgi:putative ABC transport system ATP-binding protein